MPQKAMVYQKPSSDNCLSLPGEAYIFAALWTWTLPRIRLAGSRQIWIIFAP